MGIVVSTVTPVEVHKAIERFCNEHGESSAVMPGYEFAHIVLDDYNLTDGHIQWCIDRAEAWEQERKAGIQKWALPAATSHYFEVVEKYRKDCTTFLQWLLTVPGSVRLEAEPYGYGEGDDQ